MIKFDISKIHDTSLQNIEFLTREPPKSIEAWNIRKKYNQILYLSD